ncbi:MAG: hypothetical protein MUE55_04130 [Thermoplasmata archaeon]|nr:hypothetical protein [Thermoplasmata archaeon]
MVVMASGDMLIDDARDFVKNVAGFSGRKVVASLSRADEGVQAFLQKNGVHYWGREEIEHEVGSLQLETLSDGKGHSLLDDVISDESPQRPFEPPEQAIPVIVESTTERAERIVKPNFTLEDMKHIARHEVQGYKFELELVPHYLFHYVLEIGEGKQRAGIVAVNGLTGQVETWRWGFELVDNIDIVHARREPKIDEDKARAAAVKSIEEEARSLLETVKDFGHSEIIERKKGLKESMPIEGKGLVYLPVWCIEGKGGAMIVNSSSGKIISEHLHGTEAKLG